MVFLSVCFIVMLFNVNLEIGVWLYLWSIKVWLVDVMFKFFIVIFFSSGGKLLVLFFL